MTVTPSRQGRHLPIIEYRPGIDQRIQHRSERMLGRLGWSAYHQELTWSAQGFYGNKLDDMPAEYSGFTPPGFRPFVVEPDDMPYALDDGDEQFGDDCRFVCYAIEPDNTPGLQKYDPLAPNHFTKQCQFPNRLQWWTYVAYGIPAAATCTLTLKAFFNTTAEVVIGSVVVHGSNGSQQWIVLPAFDGTPPTGASPAVVFDWVGGTPISHGLTSQPRYRGHYYAVPKTLPPGYTPRTGAEDQFTQPMGVFVRDFDHPGRQRTGPYAPPANYWHQASFLGFQTEPHKGAMWFDMGPPDGWRKRYTYWWPTTDQTIQTLTQQYLSDLHFPFPLPGFDFDMPATADVSVAGNGWRKITLTVTVPSIGTHGRSFTYKVTRPDTGATLATLTFTEAEMLAGTKKDVATNVLPSTNLPMFLTLHVTDQTFPYTYGAPTAVLRAHPRLDVPLPFNAVNEQNTLVAGGYDPITLFIPENDYPMLTPTLGTLSVQQAISGQPIAYLPNADNWYKVTDTTGLVGGIGEDEFRWGTRANIRTADRGHANRRFYAFPTDTINPSVLGVFTPSFNVIASGGTQLETTQGGVWAFGTISFPSAGTYDIDVYINDYAQLIRGVVMEGTDSVTDTACVNPQWREVFETWFTAGATQTTSGMSFQGVKSLAVLAPDPNDFWVLGDDADGLFGSHPTNAWSAFNKNDLVCWSEVIGDWVTFTPVAGMVVIPPSASSLSPLYFNGFVWKDNSTPALTKRLTVDGATTIRLTFSPFDHRFIFTSDHPHLSVFWEKV